MQFKLFVDLGSTTCQSFSNSTNEMMKNPDDCDVPIDEPNQPPPEIVGWSNRTGIIVVGVLVSAFLLVTNSDRIGRWWEHRQNQFAYVDSMTLEKGDIQLRDVGGHFKKGKFYLRVVLDHKLPNNGMGGIDDTQFAVNWKVF